MTTFAYKGVDKSGAAIDGVIEAVDRRVAVGELAGRGHFVSELIERHSSGVAVEASSSAKSVRKQMSFGSGRITHKDIVAMTSQLSTALRAGLPVLNAIHIIA